MSMYVYSCSCGAYVSEPVCVSVGGGQNLMPGIFCIALHLTNYEWWVGEICNMVCVRVRTE